MDAGSSHPSDCFIFHDLTSIHDLNIAVIDHFLLLKWFSRNSQYCEHTTNNFSLHQPCCCACGGGTNEKRPSSAPSISSSPSDSSKPSGNPSVSSNPTDSFKPSTCDTPGWVDSYGDGCDWYELVDLPGCPYYGSSYEGEMGVADDNCCYCAGTGVSWLVH